MDCGAVELPTLANFSISLFSFHLVDCVKGSIYICVQTILLILHDFGIVEVVKVRSI